MRGVDNGFMQNNTSGMMHHAMINAFMSAGKKDVNCD